jgi:hypothetical protein
LGINLRRKLVKFYICSVAVCGAETWTLRTVDQKYLNSFEMWCWRRMKNISWTCCFKYEGVHTAENLAEKEYSITIKRRKCSCIGHTLQRNCLLKFLIKKSIERRIEMMERRRTCKQLLNGLKETREYWKLKAEAKIALWNSVWKRI